MCVHQEETYIGDSSKEEVCCASNADGYKPLTRWSINDVIEGKWNTLLHCPRKFCPLWQLHLKSHRLSNSYFSCLGSVCTFLHALLT